MTTAHDAVLAYHQRRTSTFKRIIFCLLTVLLLSGTWQVALASAKDPQIRIGVTSFRAIEQTRQQWQSTADYLNKAIPGYHFSIVPLRLDEFSEVVKQGQVEFVLTNPEHYILLRSEYGLAALATLMNSVEGHPVSHFGGTIFTRAERADINELADLRGKVLATVGKNSFAAYLLQRWTLFKHGIEITDVHKINFVGLPQDKVVLEVLNGHADVGFVRTGVLEAMAGENNYSLTRSRY